MASVDSDLVVLGGSDGTLVVWNIRTGDSTATHIDCGAITRLHAVPLVSKHSSASQEAEDASSPAFAERTHQSIYVDKRHLEPPRLSDQDDIARMAVRTVSGESMVFDITRSGRLRFTAVSRYAVVSRLGRALDVAILPQPQVQGSATTRVTLLDCGNIATLQVERTGAPVLRGVLESAIQELPAKREKPEALEGEEIERRRAIAIGPSLSDVCVLSRSIRRFLRVMLQLGVPSQLFVSVAVAAVPHGRQAGETSSHDSPENMLKAFLSQKLDMPLDEGMDENDVSEERMVDVQSPASDAMQAVLMTPMVSSHSPVSSPGASSDNTTNTQDAAAKLGYRQQSSGSTSALKKLGGAFKDMAMDVARVGRAATAGGASSTSNALDGGGGGESPAMFGALEGHLGVRENSNIFEITLDGIERAKRGSVLRKWVDSSMQVLITTLKARGLGSIFDEEELRMYSNAESASSRMMVAAMLLNSSQEEITFWQRLPATLLALRAQQSLQASTLDAPEGAALHVTSTTPGLTGRIHPAGLLLWSPKREIRSSSERACWYSKMPPDQLDEQTEVSLQERRVIEQIALGDFQSAVGLLLSSPPVGSSKFYRDAVCALGMAFACGVLSVDRSQGTEGRQSGAHCSTDTLALPLDAEPTPSFRSVSNTDRSTDDDVSLVVHEAARTLFVQSTKVIVANAASFGDTLLGVPLLCSTGDYREAVTCLQNSGFWTSAATLMASSMSAQARNGSMLKWANYMAESQGRVWQAAGVLIGNGQIEAAVDLLVRGGFSDAAMTVIYSMEEMDMELKDVALKTVVKQRFIEGVQNIMASLDK